MSGSPRFGPHWRERKIEALERQLGELHWEPTRPWDRHPVIPYEVTRFEEYLKIDPAVVFHVGRSRREILSEPGWESFVHPDDRDRVNRAWKRFALVGKPIEGLELRYLHVRTGRYVYVEDYLYPVSWGRDGRPIRFAAWFENITQRKRAEIDFLLACLDNSARPKAREARREIVRRSLLEPRDPDLPLDFLRPLPRPRR